LMLRAVALALRGLMLRAVADRPYSIFQHPLDFSWQVYPCTVTNTQKDSTLYISAYLVVSSRNDSSINALCVCLGFVFAAVNTLP
jgi:hypothetical protein